MPKSPSEVFRSMLYELHWWYITSCGHGSSAPELADMLRKGSYRQLLGHPDLVKALMETDLMNDIDVNVGVQLLVDAHSHNAPMVGGSFVCILTPTHFFQDFGKGRSCCCC
jgi:hypothetical protein